ncbi:M48 family peptidase [Parasulfuritortus cantonensis]|uniref:M48 family peptidase n=1 Tax=Parasulfuritortus cantonensis TaxID=2528202 RepID=A0A4R1BEI0_9PROT|nr:M48 family peptidase [Parasulfuritortus cantonensis]
MALPDGRLDYLLKRSSARRTLSLGVDDQGRVRVNAPMATPQSAIDAFLVRHLDWLRRHLAARPAPFAWADGAALPYLGGQLRLTLVTGPGPARLADDRLVCPAGAAEAAALAWYRAEARRVLGACLAAACRELGLAEPPWRLSDARTRWGSLSAKGVVGLNWRLVKATPAEIDYVVRHELAHLRHRDHSPAYWREVARLCPDYRAARARLRADAARLMAF